MIKPQVARNEFYSGTTLESGRIRGVLYRVMESLGRKEEIREINWPSLGGVSISEAREFAAAILAVADALEKEATR